MRSLVCMSLMVLTLCAPGYCRRKQAPAPTCDISFFVSAQSKIDSLDAPALARYFGSYSDTSCMSDMDYSDWLNRLIYPVFIKYTDSSLVTLQHVGDREKSLVLRNLEKPQTASLEDVKTLHLVITRMEIEYRLKKRLLLALQRAIDNYGNDAR